MRHGVRRYQPTFRQFPLHEAELPPCKVWAAVSTSHSNREHEDRFPLSQKQEVHFRLLPLFLRPYLLHLLQRQHAIRVRESVFHLL